MARSVAESRHIPVSRKARGASVAVSPACRRSSSARLDSTARSSSVKTSAVLFGLRLAVMCPDPPVSRRRRLGLRLQPAYRAPIHVVGPGDVRAAIAFRQTRKHFGALVRREHARPAKANATRLRALASFTGALGGESRRRSIKPTLTDRLARTLKSVGAISVEDNLMRKILTALIAAASVGATAIACPSPAKAWWGWGPAVAGGVVAGAIVGGAIASTRPYYPPPYYYGPYYGPLPPTLGA